MGYFKIFFLVNLKTILKFSNMSNRMGVLSGKGPNPLYHYLRINRRLYVAWLKTVASGRMAAAAVGCRTAAAVVLVDKICSVEAAQFRALDVGVGERGVIMLHSNYELC